MRGEYEMTLMEKIKKPERTEAPTIDRANIQLFEKAKKDGVSTAFDRVKLIEPVCKFCQEGVSCRNCMMGPCRITPKAQTGVCGATADTMVARGLLRNVLAGASSHMDHARHVALTLLSAGKGEAPYKIKDEGKLKALASSLNIDDEEDINKLAIQVATKALEDLGAQNGATLNWIKMHATQERIETWKNLGVMPEGGDRTITEGMHRSTMGVDADPVNITLGTIKAGIADGLLGLHMASDIQDVLFGTPSPKMSKASLGVLDTDYVNIAVHGHVPLLSEMIVSASEELEEEAKETGAKGINIVGICCTGNELLARQGVPMAGNVLNSELALVTGAVDAIVVDVQCIFPALVKVAQAYHTKIITTSPIAKIPGAEHIEFNEKKADEISQTIVRVAIENFKNRDEANITIPDVTTDAMVGFSVESIIEVLGKINPDDPLKALIDNIAEGNIRGVVAIVGCNNPKVKHDFMHVEIAKELIKNDVLVLATGCAAIAHAKYGLMSPEGYKQAGEKLQGVLKALGEAAGVEALPPVLHFGSCVDNSRIGVLLKALSEKLGVPIMDLPVAASAPEATTEKALSIGTWAVALGITTHVNPVPRILGSKTITKLLTEDAEGLLGGKFLVSPDPKEAATMMLEVIDSKREKLGLVT